MARRSSSQRSRSARQQLRFENLEARQLLATITAGPQISGGDWQSTDVAKAGDPDVDNILGESGYVWYATKPSTSDPSGCPGGNPLTFSSGVVQTRSNIPSFITLSNNGQNTVCHYGYPPIDNPTAAPGAGVANVISGLAVRQGVTKGTEGDMLNITVNEGFPTSGLRIGVAVHGDGGDAVDRIRLRQTTGGTANVQSTVTRTGSSAIQILYFDITNANIGDVFTLSLTKDAAAPGNANILYAGLTFDALNNSNLTHPSLTNLSPIPAAEGATRPVGSPHVKVFDGNSSAAQLNYTLMQIPAQGQILKSGSPLSIGGTFTQDDINNNRITYAHNGSETLTDGFVFQISDNSGNGINVIDASFDVRPGGIFLNGSAALRNNRLELTEALGSQNGTIIIAKPGPAHVTRGFNASFDMYLGNPSGDGADGAAFVFGPLADNALFGEQGINPGLTVSFDTYSNGATDPANSIEIWYNGAMIGQVTGVPLETNSFVPVSISVNAQGQISVAHNGVPRFTNLQIPGFNPAANWRWGLSGRTGGVVQNNFIDNLKIDETVIAADIHIAPVVDNPSLPTINLLTLNEATSAVVSAALLSTSDASGPAQLTYTVQTLPTAGRLLRNNVPLAVGGTFTQQDINLGLIAYAQADATNASGDNFTFIVRDGDGHLPTINIIDANFDDNAVPANVILNRNNADSGLVQNGRLELTPSTASRSGTAVINKPNPTQILAGFQANFDLYLGNPSGNGADGLSFVYSNVPDNALFGENTSTAGLQIQFDTYDNGSAEAPAIDIVYNNAIISSVKLTDAQLETNSFVPVTIEVTPDGRVSVFHNNRLIFNRVQVPGWSPQNDWRFAVGHRTGGAFERGWVDNLRIDGELGALFTFPISITNIAPIAAVSGPDVGVFNYELEFELTAVEPQASEAGNLTYIVDWGDGVVENIPGDALGTLAYHTYDDLGNYVITVVANDGEEDGPEFTHEIRIQPVATVGDDVIVMGREGADRIIVSYSANGLQVRYNNTIYRDLDLGAGKVVVYGEGSNDTITYAGRFAVPLEVHGGEGNDYIAGSSDADELYGDEGNDRILGGNGDDLLDGGEGNDRLYGGNGNDIMYGRAGNDLLNGDGGDDWLLGGEGNDTLNGGNGNDFLRGGSDNDRLNGGNGDDLLLGDTGGDLLYGRNGNDVLIGGEDFDRLYGGSHNDLVIGQATIYEEFDEEEYDEFVLVDLYALWLGWQFDPTAGVADVPLDQGSIADDGEVDNLYGERGNDWFLYYDIAATRDDNTVDLLTDLNDT